VVKASDKPAFTVGLRMGVTPDGLFFITSVVRGQWSPLHVELAAKQTAAIDSTHIPIWIEQEPGSSGKSLIDHYRRNVLRGFELRGNPKRTSKLTCWGPLASAAEAGNVILVNGPWINDFLAEIELAPDGQFVDQVDAAAGALEKLSGVGAGTNIRISMVDSKPSGREVAKPTVRHGQQIIPVYEGDKIVGYDVIGR